MNPFEGGFKLQDSLNSFMLYLEHDYFIKYN